MHTPKISHLHYIGFTFIYHLQQNLPVSIFKLGPRTIQISPHIENHMLSTWVSHAHLTKYHMLTTWASHAHLTNITWVSHAHLTNITWVSHAHLTNITWVSHAHLTNITWVSHAHLTNITCSLHGYHIHIIWIDEKTYRFPFSNSVPAQSGLVHTLNSKSGVMHGSPTL